MANSPKNKNANQKGNNPKGVSSKGNKAPTPTPKPEREKLTKKQIIIIICVMLCAVLISSTIIGAVIFIKKRENPDFMTAKLSRYISISEDDYKGYEINIPLDSYSESDLEREINILLAENKKLSDVYGGGYAPDAALTLGDEVKIYYRGYQIDENGREKDFEGSSNFTDEIIILEVGTGNVMSSDTGEIEGSYIPGFGESLVGKIPSEYPELRKIKDGRVLAGDVIYLSYTVMGEGGNKTVKGERIDLSLSYIDEIYGKGFTEHFVGTLDENGAPKGFKNIGEDAGKLITRIGDDKTDTVYSDMKIEFATRGCENEPLTISVRFPEDYSEKSLRAKEAKFDIYIESAVVYDVPEFNDKFVTETLKQTAESLSAYSGETLADKYKAKLKKDISKEIEESNHSLLEEAMWDYLMAKAEVKRIPKKTVEVYYQSYYTTIGNQYYNGNYSSTYGSLDAFAVAYLNYYYGAGLESGGNWKGYITYLAEQDVVRKLLFYYIIRENDFFPSDEEYEKIYQEVYNDLLADFVKIYETQLSGLEGAEYDEKYASIKKTFDDYYGEEYFEEQTYYYYGTRKMLSLAVIK